MNAVRPFEPFDGSVEASKVKVSEIPALEMKILSPLIMYLLPSLTAFVDTEPKSDPDPGSV